jgi:hypothetical protein
VKIGRVPPVNPPITPNAESLGAMLTKFFKVPRYQRTYDWSDEQVGDFVADALRLYEAQLAGSADWHFFGAAITISVPAPETVPKMYFEVVDGQQRLATLVLTLSEIGRALTDAKNEAEADGDTGTAAAAGVQIEKIAKLVEEHNLPRLELSRRDREYFAECVAGTATAPKRDADEAHKKLHSARQAIHDGLIDEVRKGAATCDERVTRLTDLLAAILERGYLVHLSTDDRAEAYRLFAVLNDRGRQLSVGSLLRTYSLSLVEGFDSQSDEVERLWDEILALGESWVDNFLDAYYVSYTGVRITKGGTYDAYLDQFSGGLLPQPATKDSEADAVRDFAATLRAEAAFYEQLQDAEWPFPNGSASLLDRDLLLRLVKLLPHRLAFPLLLAVGRECGEAKFTRLVPLVERFAYRYINISRGNADALAKRAYYPVAKTARAKGTYDEKELKKQLKRLLEDYANDEVFGTGLKELVKYREGAPAENRRIKHFLTTLEDYYSWWKGGASGKPSPTKHSVFDFKQTNLEHVYPQNPQPGDEDAALDVVINDLGNLTLLDEGDGVVAGNESFVQKQPIYQISKIALSRELADEQQWTINEVEKRADQYVEMALKIFVV